MSRWIKCLTGLAITSLAISACVSPEESSKSPLSSPLSAEKQTAPTINADVSDSPLNASPISPAEEQAVAAARQALAEQLSVETERITLVSVERVEFGDTSLGCPQPGMMYAQVITPGYRVILMQDGQTYDWRVSGDRAELCEPVAREKPPAGGGNVGELPPDLAQAAEAAIKALVEKMQVAEEQIEIVSVESVEFRDSSLGCPQPGMAYLQVITPGYQVLLSLDGQVYDYRVSRQRTTLCVKSE